MRLLDLDKRILIHIDKNKHHASGSLSTASRKQPARWKACAVASLMWARLCGISLLPCGRRDNFTLPGVAANMQSFSVLGLSREADRLMSF